MQPSTNYLIEFGLATAGASILSLSQEMKTEEDNETFDDKTNVVSSVLFAPVSLSKVEEALKKQFPEAKVSIYTSGYNGAMTIHLQSDDADFEGYPDSTEGSGSDSDYLFNGSIEGEPDAVVAKAQSLFARLMDAGMTVQYEVYDSTGNVLVEQQQTRR
jgi:alkanesulfonate monooxygenase SsuD/methylene tetrahydromethanopterin reductase-like flavin-dependent oxidoreductase (luciferase family)